MLLRERLWRQRLRLEKHKKLPKMHSRYNDTQTWATLRGVLDVDLNRMPRMNRDNVTRLVKRHAATVPWHPYTQGHLYLIHTLALVLHDEMSLYWGYARICRMVHPYGPDTAYETRVIPDYVYDVISDTIDVERDLFDVVLRMRWVYVIFGQTFTNASGICSVWDYVLCEFSNIYRICAALHV